MLCVAIGTTKVNGMSFVWACEGKAEKFTCLSKRDSLLLLPLLFFLFCSSSSLFSATHPSSLPSLVYRQISSPHLPHKLYFEKGSLIDTDSDLIALASL